MATGWMTGAVSDSSTSPHWNWLWNPPCILYSIYQGIFLRVKAAGAWRWPLVSFQYWGL